MTDEGVRIRRRDARYARVPEAFLYGRGGAASNMALERTAGLHSLAAAHRRRSPHWRRIRHVAARPVASLLLRTEDVIA